LESPGGNKTPERVCGAVEGSRETSAFCGAAALGHAFDGIGDDAVRPQVLSAGREDRLSGSRGDSALA
jgi:hypothetical protein